MPMERRGFGRIRGTFVRAVTCDSGETGEGEAKAAEAGRREIFGLRIAAGGSDPYRGRSQAIVFFAESVRTMP